MDGNPEPSTEASHTTDQSSKTLPIGRREYLRYTGAFTGINLAGHSVAAESEDDGNGSSEGIVPIDLQVEDTTQPLVIDNEHPDLSWRLIADGRGQTQSAYRVLVASSPERLTKGECDLWDSGIISSGEPRAEYQGDTLESGTGYYWKVRVWDENDNPSAWSDPSYWEMGLLDPDDWTAAWIRMETDEEFQDNQFRYARREFDLPNGLVTRARAYIAAGHQYQLWCNGQSVDVGPSFSYPDKQYYKAVDVTDALNAGNRNVLGALYNWNGPGQGRPRSEPGLLIQLSVEYENGSTEVVTTNGDWRVHDAPWLSAPDRNGDLGEPVEAIDGRKVIDGWTDVGFDDTDWNTPEVVGTHPAEPWTELIGQNREVVGHVTEPVSVEKIEQSTLTIVDDHLRVTGGDVTLLNHGREWTDYTFEVDVRRPTNTDNRPAAGIVFRASDPDNGYMWQLGGENESSELRLHVIEDGEHRLLDTVSLDSNRGIWYHLRVDVNGPQIRTFVDGKEVDTRTDDTFEAGTIGFREDDGEIGEFDDVHVTGPNGETLFTDDFSNNFNAWDVGPVYVADFGRVISAIPRVRFADGEAGRRVDMRAGYLLNNDGTVSAERGTQSTNMRYDYVQRDGEQTYKPFLYLGFRYFQVEAPGERLTEDDIWAFARHNEVPDVNAATFSSSNEMLDNVWKLASHSALYGSQEQFVDTPTREKGQFLGDTFNVSTTTMRAFDERKLTQQAIREFARSQERYWSDTGRLNAVYPNGDGKRDIPDYTEKYPEWVWQYYIETGDEKLLADIYPVIQNVAEYIDRHVDAETGLITYLSGGGGDYEYGIIDWPPQMRYDYDVDTAARTTVNALGANALQRTAQIAEVLGHSNESSTYADRAVSIRDAMNEHLRRDDDVYVDGLKDDGSQSSHASQHANAFPLALGLVPEDDIEPVADYIVNYEGTVRMGPMTIQWLLYGLAETGRYEALLDVITDPSHDGWANILERDGTFVWESWDAREEEQSLSHPWGATVLIAIQQAFLGVRITEPGASHVVIEPPAASLSRASGRAPTQRGPVEVEWGRDNEFTLRTNVPANVTATVRIPISVEKFRLREGSKPIWNNGNRTRPHHSGIKDVTREDDHVVVEIESGEYTFDLE